MSTSGKSSNRLSEYNRGLSGNGHGIYAEEGKRERKRRQEAEDEKKDKKTRKDSNGSD